MRSDGLLIFVTLVDIEECSCTHVHNFLTLSMQRYGSGWFETLLNNHLNVNSHGELFANESRREIFASIKQTFDSNGCLIR